MEIYNWDCLEKMKDLETGSVDLLFCDLPYGQTSCKWDCLIDLELFWKEVHRVCKINAPMFFTCSTKFGVSLINSNPKYFRYDLVWVKSAPTGFLNAKKMPMKKHEMVYVFYRKLPFYNIADNHTHKFLKQPKNEVVEKRNTNKNSVLYGKIKDSGYTTRKDGEACYDPPLPTSVMKEPEIRNCQHYNGGEPLEQVYTSNERVSSVYEPPLPNSVMKEPENEVVEPKNEDSLYGVSTEYVTKYENRKERKSVYNPALPNSILEVASQKGKHATQKPTALMEWVLKYYSRENDLVLDPTMGSGSTGVACLNMNRRFIGIEKDEKIFEDAKKRLINI